VCQAEEALNLVPVILQVHIAGRLHPHPHPHRIEVAPQEVVVAHFLQDLHPVHSREADHQDHLEVLHLLVLTDDKLKFIRLP